jgi:hypothetical protein
MDSLRHTIAQRVLQLMRPNTYAQRSDYRGLIVLRIHRKPRWYGPAIRSATTRAPRWLGNIAIRDRRISVHIGREEVFGIGFDAEDPAFDPEAIIKQCIRMIYAGN